MKKDNNTPTLQELLGSVEHAGRDARRQQQLAEMIERMAAEETAQKAAHRHTVRMWSTRIAVAATITLFLTTSIWRWSNMEGSTEAPLVAQNPIVRPTEMPLPQQPPPRTSARPRLQMIGTTPLPKSSLRPPSTFPRRWNPSPMKRYSKACDPKPAFLNWATNWPTSCPRRKSKAFIKLQSNPCHKTLHKANLLPNPIPA